MLIRNFVFQEYFSFATFSAKNWKIEKKKPTTIFEMLYSLWNKSLLTDDLPKLELQLRRSLCWEDEGPESEDTVTEVELAPTEDIEDGGAWKHKK